MKSDTNRVGLRTCVSLLSLDTGAEQWRGTLGQFINDNSRHLTLTECHRIGDELATRGECVLNLGAGGQFKLVRELPSMIELDARELATVLAALRLIAPRVGTVDRSSVCDIASDAGRLEPLTSAEIVALCARIGGAE